MEYTTETSIRGIFGRRDFTEQKEHDPLFFGSKSAGKTKCDIDISGGSLQLSFTGGSQEYTLKQEYTVRNIANNNGIVASKDARLTLDVNPALEADSLDPSEDFLIMNTFGLPAELSSKVILGPYGIFISGQPSYEKLATPINVTLQSKDAQTGTIQFYNGESWSKLETETEEGKVIFSLDQLGVIVLTE